MISGNGGDVTTSIVGMLYEISAYGGSERWQECWL